MGGRRGRCARPNTRLGAAADAAAARALLDTPSNAEVSSAISAAVAGLLYKGACRVVATANVGSLSGYPTIDGVTIGSGDANKRVLLTAQSDATQNGPWVTAAGAWARPSPNELLSSAAFPITEGTEDHDTVWYVVTNDPITAGVTAVSIQQLAREIQSSQIADAPAFGRLVLQTAALAALRVLLAMPAVSLAAYGNGAGADATWSGWTYGESGATGRTDGVVAGGRLRLTCSAGGAISPGATCAWSLAIPAALRSRSWRFRARLATLSGSTAGTRWIVATGAAYLSVLPDASVSAGPPDALSSGAALPVDGTGWIELLCQGGVITMRYGTGTSTTPPTSWVVARVYTPATHTAEPGTVVFALEEYGTPSGTVTLELDHATLGAAEDGLW